MLATLAESQRLIRRRISAVALGSSATSCDDELLAVRDAKFGEDLRQVGLDRLGAHQQFLRHLRIVSPSATSSATRVSVGESAFQPTVDEA